MPWRSLAAATILFAAAAAQAADTTPDQANRKLIESRAVEAVIWGMPAVNYDLMLQEFKRIGGTENQIVYWSRPLDGNNQTLTPNPDSIYFMAFYNTKDGPVVLEIPPAGDDGSVNANIVTTWQMPLADGGPYGTDKGQGGKYLLLPPGYTGTVPEGYIPLQSDTYGGYALIRSNLKSHSDADVARSVAYGKRVKLYPLSEAANPPETVFVDAADVVFDSTIHYDASFFDRLNRIVQDEPWIPRDRAMIDQLKTIGIEKGKPFNPDDKMKAVFDEAAQQAKVLLEARYDAGFPPFYEGTHWTLPALPELVKAMQTDFSQPNSYPIDARGLTYTYAFVGLKKLGAGQFYLINIKDKDGDAYDGGKNYRLHVPADPPVKQYWSVTVYDRELHTLLRDVKRASRASNASDVQKNDDGSVDVYFGPEPPPGKESNWVPTKPGREFELMFRLYAPTEALFEKTWKLPDVEKVTSTVAASAAESIPVTVDNFVRAESDLYFAGALKDAGGVGRFFHNRKPTPIDNQTVIRMNRDTLYSGAVFDLDAGPVTITLPDAGDRFMSMQVINEDEYTPMVVYDAGAYTLTKDKIGTRYVITAIRTLADPNDAKDILQANSLQDAIKVEQPGGPGVFEVPNWDQTSQKKVRDALLVLGSTLPDFKGAFGTKEEVDPVRHLIGAAAAWGGNPVKDAIYLNVTPPKNDGKTTYKLDVKDVPVDGFWSITVYNVEGYLQANPYNAYSLNNITAKKSEDGSVAIQFGGCDGKIPNCLPIMEGWNYTVRLYRPRTEILNGSWKFPEAQPVG